MKLNEHTALLTPKVLLVPYSPHHVPTYHEWMQNEDLQKATASEPLTLEEEHSMQQSWREDADKLTFICCTAPPLPPPSTVPGNGKGEGPKTGTEDEAEGGSIVIKSEEDDAPDAMVGDINLFLSLDDDDDDDEEDGEASLLPSTTIAKPQPLVGEVEIMIARTTYQNRGLGSEILSTFLWYIFTSLPSITQGYSGGKTESYLKYLRVKISAENMRSVRLFEKVGFKKVAEEANYFGELELRWPVLVEIVGELEKKMKSVPKVVGYK